MDNGHGVCTLNMSDGAPGGDDALKYHVMVRKSEPVAERVERMEALLEVAFSMHASNSADQASTATPQATTPLTPAMTPPGNGGAVDAVSADIDYLHNLLAMDSSPLVTKLKSLMNSSPYQPFILSEDAQQRQRVKEMIREGILEGGQKLTFETVA